MNGTRQFLAGHPDVVDALVAFGIDANPGYLPHVVAGWYLPDNADRGWALTRHLVLELAREVRADGAKFVVVTIPSRVQVITPLREVAALLYAGDPAVKAFLAEQSRPQKRFRTLAKKSGIPTLDLAPAVDDSTNGAVYYYPSVAHWNEEGHRVAARAIERFLLESRLLAAAD
jgi:hypothetical protein